MFKSLLGALLLSCSLVSIAEPLVLKQPNSSLSDSKCQSGCVVLDQSDVEKLQQSIQEALQGAFMAGMAGGYQQGAQEALEAAKTNPKICPKNI